MELKAYAKINLSLDVVGKKENGYHLLEMIMQTIDLYDIIRVEKSEKGINLECNKSYIPLDNRNLAYRAADLFMEEYKINSGVHISILKNIPVAAGLAGGSTDAAAVIKAMNKIFNVNADLEELKTLGLNIGADVPYCIIGGTALCEGIGERITSLPVFGNHILVLVKPSFGISTKEVYSNLELNKIYRHPDTQSMIEAIKRQDINYVSENMKNVLENVTLKKHTILKDIKNEMIKMKALGALMSGSGPTVFGIFDDMMKAQFCYDRMKIKYKEVYITRTI